ncbi:MAG: hypothetical protein WDW36_005126 [Sanguina aurantia]
MHQLGRGLACADGTGAGTSRDSGGLQAAAINGVLRSALVSKCAASCHDGTCNEEIGLCDCPRHMRGEHCETPVDSLEEVCRHFKYRDVGLCMAEVQNRCLNQCNRRGKCIAGGFCKCDPGVWGNDCALSMGPDGKPVLLEGQGYKVSRTNSAIVLLCSPRPSGPRIYIYELPPEFSSHLNIPHLDRPLHALLWQRFLTAGVRVADGEQADYYFMPLSLRDHPDYAKIPAAIQYVRQHWPYWDRLNGSAHMWVSATDMGRAEIPKELLDLTDSGIWLTYWGLYQQHPISNWQPAHRPGQDIVLPVMLPTRSVWTGGLESTALHPGSPNHASRHTKATTLYMAGRICGDRAAPLNTSVPGKAACSEQRKDYSALTRAKVFSWHAHRPGYRIVTGSKTFAADMTDSRFCLAPTGGGHGKRNVMVTILGCVPVTVTDGVLQPYEPEMDWSAFSLPVKEKDIPRMHELLAGVTDSTYDAMLVRQRSGRSRRTWCHHQPVLAAALAAALSAVHLSLIPPLWRWCDTLSHSRTAWDWVAELAAVPTEILAGAGLGCVPPVTCPVPHCSPPKDRMACSAQHLYWTSFFGAILGETGNFDAFETLLAILAARLRHPGLAPGKLAGADPPFRRFLDCLPALSEDHEDQDASTAGSGVETSSSATPQGAPDSQRPGVGAAHSGGAYPPPPSSSNSPQGSASPLQQQQRPSAPASPESPAASIPHPAPPAAPPSAPPPPLAPAPVPVWGRKPPAEILRAHTPAANAASSTATSPAGQHQQLNHASFSGQASASAAATGSRKQASAPSARPGSVRPPAPAAGLPAQEKAFVSLGKVSSTARSAQPPKGVVQPPSTVPSLEADPPAATSSPAAAPRSSPQAAPVAVPAVQESSHDSQASADSTSSVIAAPPAIPASVTPAAAPISPPTHLPVLLANGISTPATSVMPDGVSNPAAAPSASSTSAQQSSSSHSPTSESVGPGSTPTSITSLPASESPPQAASAAPPSSTAAAAPSEAAPSVERESVPAQQKSVWGSRPPAAILNLRTPSNAAPAPPAAATVSGNAGGRSGANRQEPHPRNNGQQHQQQQGHQHHDTRSTQPTQHQPQAPQQQQQHAQGTRNGGHTTEQHLAISQHTQQQHVREVASTQQQQHHQQHQQQQQNAQQQARSEQPQPRPQAQPHSPAPPGFPCTLQEQAAAAGAAHGAAAAAAAAATPVSTQPHSDTPGPTCSSSSSSAQVVPVRVGNAAAAAPLW